MGLLYGVPAVSLTLTLLTDNFAIYNGALLPVIAILAIALIGATTHNLRRVRDRVVRAQIGWVALGIASPLLAALLNGTLIDRLFPNLTYSQG